MSSLWQPPKDPAEWVYMRNSERATYRDCRLKWKWGYLDRLSATRTRGALAFGTLAHEALAERYPPGRKRGPHPAETFERLYLAQPNAFDQWDDEGNKHDALELGISIMNGYVDEYGDDDHIDIIAPEMPLLFHVYDKQGRYLATWVGRTDAAYVDLRLSTPRRKRVGFFEHKTAKSIETELRINSGYGEQSMSYWFGGTMMLLEKGILDPGTSVDHVRVNWLRKAMPSDKPRNEKGHVLNKPSKDRLTQECEALGLELPKRGATVAFMTDLLEQHGVDVPQLGEPAVRQPAPIFHRHDLDFGDGMLEQIKWRISAQAWEMNQARAGLLPIYKNPTKDCSWKCEFVDVCELHEMGEDYESVLQLEFEEWDPYESADKETR